MRHHNVFFSKITLTNGEVFVSNVPFTFEMYKALSSDLELVYSYNAYLLESVQSQMKYLKIDDEMAVIIQNNRSLFKILN